MEVQRHSNVAPIAIAHRTIRKTSLQEYIIPKVRQSCYSTSNLYLTIIDVYYFRIH